MRDVERPRFPGGTSCGVQIAQPKNNSESHKDGRRNYAQESPPLHGITERKGQRREPADGDVPFVSERIGWLPFAAQSGSAILLLVGRRLTGFVLGYIVEPTRGVGVLLILKVNHLI